MASKPRGSPDRRYYVLFAAIIVASFGITWILLSAPPQEKYSVENGILSYTGRPPVTYGQEVWNETDDRIIYRVWYPSHGNATIYGLLAVPKLDGPLPAFFIMPGATVTKEGEQSLLGNALNELGFVTLSLDQRGHGETAEIGNAPFVLGFEDDYPLWRDGYESQYHMWTYDALRAFDLLHQLPGIDRSRIYAAGESLGGNFAMVSAGIEPRISGLMLISSSGFKFQPQADPNAAGYLKSIMGDTYIGMVSPRPFLMLQALDDQVVRPQDAMDTFSKAGEPKRFLTVNGTTHSYHGDMKGILTEGLRGW